MILLSKVIK